MPGTGLTSSDDEEGFVPSQLNAGASGKMTYATVQQQQQNTLNTLDEPVWVTIKRDLLNIWSKLQQVLLPRGNKDALRDWDLWGPLLLCLLLASLLGLKAPNDQAPLVFAGVFVIIWCGAGVVTVNGKLLGGKLSFFQSVCVLGYCVFPLVVVSIIDVFLSWRWLKAILCSVAFAWSTFASVGFLGNVNLEQRRLLALYPIFLFYFILGWIIFVS